MAPSRQGPLSARKNDKRKIQDLSVEEEVVVDNKHKRKKQNSQEAEQGAGQGGDFADPVPGPCPECKDEMTYWDGMLNFACTACGHEWAVADAGAGSDAPKDSNGIPLSDGDTCVLVKDLLKGTLKKGLTVRNIKLGDYGDGHDVRAKVPERSSLWYVLEPP